MSRRICSERASRSALPVPETADPSDTVVSVRETEDSSDTLVLHVTVTQLIREAESILIRFVRTWHTKFRTLAGSTQEHHLWCGLSKEKKYFS